MPSAIRLPAAELFHLNRLTTIEVVNWVLVFVVAAFLYQLLTEMLFRNRGKVCPGCGLEDQPQNFTTCPLCGILLTEVVETVSRTQRLISYAVPCATLLVAMVGYNRLALVDYGSQVVVLAYVVVNAVFALLFLHHKDLRLRTLFNVPFWGTIVLVMLAVFADALVRTGGWAASAAPAAAVTDMEIGPDETPIFALRDGTLCRGIGPTAYPYFRGTPVHRLVKSGNGDVLVYLQSFSLARPDAVIGPVGLSFAPRPGRVELGLRFRMGTSQLPPEVVHQLDRAAYQPHVDFCSNGDRLWFADGSRLLRIDSAGKLETFSLGRRELGQLLKVTASKNTVWLLSERGLTGIMTSSDRKLYYPLVDAEFAVREGQKRALIQAGAISGDSLWFVTTNGDVMRFDLKKERISFEGTLRCPRYLDFYSLYSLPIIFLALAWTLAANFRPREKP